ncbi:MAG: competence/damage-inducible protein A [Proteobacteria bacterium]|nr:competence/damage-inducible protein A [Pseudomonadota bacterium]
MSTTPTARLVIIGNEILSGKVEDSNGPHLLRRLRQLGIRCTGVDVVPDELDRIATAVREAAEAADVVFTTGGVGPTHDDCTMEGVAQAFGVELVDDPELVRLLVEVWKAPPSAARMRMARVPAGAEVTAGHRFPQVRFRNVWILPGVPQLMRSKFEAIAEQLEGVPLACAALRTMQRESAIAEHLEATDAAFEEVEIGSYPRWDTDEYRVLVTLEAPDPDRVAAALADLAARLDPDQLRGLIPEYRPEERAP